MLHKLNRLKNFGLKKFAKSSNYNFTKVETDSKKVPNWIKTFLLKNPYVSSKLNKNYGFFITNELFCFGAFFGSVSISKSKDEFLLLPLSNLFQTSIKFENLIEFEFSREKP